MRERVLWTAVKRALLAIVAAIDVYLTDGKDTEPAARSRH